ncbi:ribosomal protein L1 [Daedalea quercina L-15889]|uniref:Ribosomal protein n=1 Tax=Daedalea quercina L-15889 TaxID=1314783 RepID=A0A165T4X0_9APHY|nr:ribosomal protein L1 [Daedalea quercina L-15889]
MSAFLVQLGGRCHPFDGLLSRRTWQSCRQFHGSQVVLARRDKQKVVALTKSQLAAKARKKALKSRKNFYAGEKMTLEDAINVLRAVEVAAPNSTYELVIKTLLTKGTAIPKGRYSLPRQTKEVSQDRILVFAEGKIADEAKRAGADIVGGQELVDGIISGRHQASMFLCTPDLIRAITPKLGRVLGPRGLMPSERRGTVTADIAGFIRKLKGTSEWRGDKEGTIRTPIAKMNFPIADVVRNVRYFMRVIKEATGNLVDLESRDSNKKPQTAITRVVLSSRQGPGITISDA